MSNTEKIRSTMASIQKTGKITSAMQMVATSKLGKTQRQMATSRPFAEKIRQVIGHIATSRTEYRHPFMKKHDRIARVGFIIVSSDRGLCGGLNTNLFKTAIQSMQAWHEKGAEIDVCLIGNKAINFFSRHKANIVAQASRLGDTPKIIDLVGIVKVMLDAYAENKLDSIFIVSNTFVNTMVQKPRVLNLLPLIPESVSSSGTASNNRDKANFSWDYIYETSPEIILNILLTRYIESQVYQSVVENIACEQASRMLAMQNATDNAKEVISELRLIYNKARQAAITRELAEIVAGAAAIS